MKDGGPRRSEAQVCILVELPDEGQAHIPDQEPSRGCRAT